MTQRKVLLVTGASAGIGAATARLAAERGYDLALNYRRDRAGAERTARDVEAAGGRALLCAGDVADPDQVADIYRELDQGFGRIDALVNNAGIVDLPATLTDMSDQRLQRMFQVNVLGALAVAREAVKRMLAKGDGGAIVNVSSAAARLGSGNQYLDYAASKGAIDTFTKGLSDEVCGHGIRVNAVRPGIIETEIHAKGGLPNRAQDLGPKVPMGRSGSADEVARPILFLLSAEASYVTGTCLDVSGGR